MNDGATEGRTNIGGSKTCTVLEMCRVMVTWGYRVRMAGCQSTMGAEHSNMGNQVTRALDCIPDYRDFSPDKMVSHRIMDIFLMQSIS